MSLKDRIVKYDPINLSYKQLRRKTTLFQILSGGSLIASAGCAYYALEHVASEIYTVYLVLSVLFLCLCASFLLNLIHYEKATLRKQIAFLTDELLYETAVLRKKIAELRELEKRLGGRK